MQGEAGEGDAAVIEAQRSARMGRSLIRMMKAWMNLKEARIVFSKFQARKALKDTNQRKERHFVASVGSETQHA
jgi:hypothetical protein